LELSPFPGLEERWGTVFIEESFPF